MRRDGEILVAEELRPEKVIPHPHDLRSGISRVETGQADGTALRRPQGRWRILNQGFILDVDDDPTADRWGMAVTGDAEVPAGASVVHGPEQEGVADVV